MKNLLKRITVFTLFVATSGILASCEKDASKKKKTSVPSSGTTTTTTTTNPISTTTPLSTLSVNWDGRVDGLYTYTQAALDFPVTSFWGGDGVRSQLSGGRLRTTLAANKLGGEGGVISRVDVTDGTEYQLQFDMMFDQNFDFSWGGKVGFGFLIGNGYTGGVPGTDGNGGSFRVMWQKATSTSPMVLKPYVYHKDQPGTYGNDFGKKFPADGSSIQKGVWYNVKMYMKSNTGYNTDGRIRLVINGLTVMDQSIRWTTNDLNRAVKNVCFETFRGGAETYWQSATNGDIYFDNVSWSRLQ